MTSPRNATSTANGRVYKWGDEEFASVTTIIGGGIPKPALKAWGERTVAEFAFDQREVWSNMSRSDAVDWLKRAPFRNTDKAATQGTDVHEWAEAYVLGQEPAELPEAQQPYARAFLDFLNDWQPEYDRTEFTVYNRTHRYAGTTDFSARIGPLGFTIADYKTSKGIYPEVAVQLSAYRRGEFIGQLDGTEAPVPAFDSAAVLHLTPKGYALVPVDAGEEAFAVFLHAKAIREFCGAQGKAMLRSPLVVSL